MGDPGIEARMRADLRGALGARDREAVSALRVALAALANAEAVPPDAAPGGSVEVARRELTEDERRAVVAEVVALHPDTAEALAPYA
jgi:uncharacterized protein YqeY